MSENRTRHGEKTAERGRATLAAGDDVRAREAAAILRRVRQETDPQIGAGSGRLLTHTLDHLAARDADGGDRMEVMGTRIGRLLGLAVFVVLAILLASRLLRA